MRALQSWNSTSDQRRALRRVPRPDRRLPNRRKGRDAREDSAELKCARHRLRLHGRRRQNVSIPRPGGGLKRRRSTRCSRASRCCASSSTSRARMRTKARSWRSGSKACQANSLRWPHRLRQKSDVPIDVAREKLAGTGVKAMGQALADALPRHVHRPRLVGLRAGRSRRNTMVLALQNYTWLLWGWPKPVPRLVCGQRTATWCWLAWHRAATSPPRHRHRCERLGLCRKKI